jgi:hypothetical protein
MAMVVGNQNYDFFELEKVLKYYLEKCNFFKNNFYHLEY